ncbi:MAG: RNA polymerase subunit sigma-70 [Phycisphaerae bacterium]|nr:RNA polymerase subunit sigma-70 [Phycisphaerae bacterium]
MQASAQTSPALTIAVNEVLASPTHSAADLIPMIYRELGAAARRAMATERDDHTLNPTALVHEAYARLATGRRRPWQNRYHFFAAAAETMRRVLIDHARGRNCSPARRPGRLSDVSSLMSLADRGGDEVLRFDEAMRRFQQNWPEAAHVLRLRLYAGLTVEQTAETLGISSSSVDRRWAFARAWLYQQLREGDEGEPAVGAGRN